MLSLVILSLSLAAPPNPVTALAWSPDGMQLAAGLRGELRLIDRKSGETVRTWSGFSGRVTALDWSHAGTIAVAYGEPGTTGRISLLDPSKDRPRYACDAHRDSIYGLAVSPDGKTLATGSYDRTIRLWTLAKMDAPPRELTDHSDAVYALAFHPSGTLLASASADRTVKVWDVSNGKRLYTLGDSTDWLYALAWSRDGKSLAAGGVDKSLRVWSVDDQSGVLRHSVFAHGGAVQRVIASGDRWITAGEDRLVKVWQSGTLRETLVVPAQPETILSLAVSPDGRTIAVGRFDGTLILLDAANGKPIRTPLPVKPKPPTLVSLTPDHGVRGKSVPLVITGKDLESVTALRPSGAKGESFTITRKSQTRIEATWTIPASAPLGKLDLIAESPHGVSKPLTLFVDRFPLAVAERSSDAASVAAPIPLPATIAGLLDRTGDVDVIRFDAKAGTPLGVELTFTGSAKWEAVLSLAGPDGTVMAESSKGTLGVIAPVAGTYSLRIRDREYRGGAGYDYRVSLGPIPVVSGVFPLAIPKGKTTTVYLHGVNLGPLATGRDVTVELTDTRTSLDLLAGIPPADRPLGNAVVALESHPAIVAAGESVRLPGIPAAADGILLKPGSSQTVSFSARKGQPLTVEGLARRYGSPVDPVIEILDAAGHSVPRATLRCTAKTVLTFRDHDAIKPGLRLETWNELAANDLLYIDGELVKIQHLPGHPDADCEFFRINGARLAYLDTTPIAHPLNSPMYKVEVHPPGATFPPNGMPVFRLDYRNDDGGPEYGKDSRLLFDPPADGVYQIRLTDARGAGGPDHAFRIVVRPRQPDFRISVSPMSPKVPRNGTLPIAVNVVRLDGFDGPIDITIDNLPRGYSVADGEIEGALSNTTIGLSATESPADAKVPAKVVASAVIAGREIRREAVLGTPSVVDPGDIATTTNVNSLSIQPGQEARFIVKVERRNGFAGRIPVEVRGLPHGVLVQNIGLNAIMITEKETEREVVIRAEPWVSTRQVPIVIVAKREGKNSDHAARPVMLNVTAVKK